MDPISASSSCNVPYFTSVEWWWKKGGGLESVVVVKRWEGARSQVAILAIGGLGHLALQFASKMGAEVTALSHSPSKKEEALSLGAHHYVITQEAAETHKGAQACC